MPKKPLIFIPNIKREAYLNVGKCISKKFINCFKFKNNLFELFIKRNPKTLNTRSKYLGLAHIFYNVCVNEGSPNIIKLDLILDWEKFVHAYKLTYESSCFQTQINVCMKDINNMISWITKPDFIFSEKANMALEPRTFYCPKDVLDEFETFTKHISQHGLERQREYMKLSMRKRLLGIDSNKR